MQFSKEIICRTETTLDLASEKSFSGHQEFNFKIKIYFTAVLGLVQNPLCAIMGAIFTLQSIKKCIGRKKNLNRINPCVFHTDLNIMLSDQHDFQKKEHKIK